MISEIVPDDDGFLIDELGQADDWVELVNAGTMPIDVGGYTLAEGSGTPRRLPAMRLPPGRALVFWADESPEQGARHLPFSLPRRGGRLLLRTLAGDIADDVRYPALATNEAWARFPDARGAFARCRFATPGRPNGARCGPPPPPELPAEVTFAPFAWPANWAAPAGPLAISEAALRAGGFVEIENTGAASVASADYSVRVAPHGPGERWPGPRDGVELAWPTAGAIAARGRAVIALPSEALAALEARPGREAVVTLFRRADAAVLDRLDVLRVPPDATLARLTGAAAQGRRGYAFALCKRATPGAANDVCDELPSREAGDRVRALSTAGDFPALAEGGTELASLAVKFLVDMEAGDVVHLLSTRAWPLHYGFVREAIEKQPHLNRCDPVEAAVFDAGWRAFSDKEYFVSEGRRYLMGTLVRHAGTGAHTVEFDAADEISGPQMRRAFFAVAARLEDPTAWAIRPQGPRQVDALKKLEGTVPVVEPNAPFRGVAFQPLTGGVTFGVLEFVPAAELGSTRVTANTIVVTVDVPNDVPLIAGLVTEAFQTPLAHVGVLCRNRGTPNMALREARKDPRLAPFLGKLVRFEVTGAGFTAREATAEEARAHADKQRAGRTPLVPRLDTTLRGPQDLARRSLDDLPAIGAKAAQLAELAHVSSEQAECLGPVPVPPNAFAVPVVHSREHFEASGARRLLDEWRAKPAFAVDPRVRSEGLRAVRDAVLAHPVDADLVRAVEQAIAARFGRRRVRLRSSSNTEDLPGFSGAGLYESVSAAVGDPERPVERGLKEVWASLWADRAYDERELGLVDHTRTAMGVLVHEAFFGLERANGVAVTRDVRNPIRSDVHYVNVQVGEASVTNPAPGVTSEELAFTYWLPSPVTYLGRSSLTAEPVIKTAEVRLIGCFMRVVHDHFQRRLDPERKNRWFTMESEFKLLGAERVLLLKQARPFSFGGLETFRDCREL